MSIFDPIIGTPDVEDAITATIALWADIYLSERERQVGLTVGTLARPASYNDTYDLENWPEGQLPGVAVVCPGTVEKPEERGSGDIEAWFEASIDLIVSDQTEALARRVAGHYQAAISTLLGQQSALKCLLTDTPQTYDPTRDDFASDLELQGYRIELPDVSNRTLAVATINLHVLVGSVYNAKAGPATPINLSDWPTPPAGGWTPNPEFEAVEVDDPLP